MPVTEIFILEASADGYVLKHLLPVVWSEGVSVFDSAMLLWTACCHLSYFSFLLVGEFTVPPTAQVHLIQISIFACFMWCIKSDRGENETQCFKN